VKQDQNTITPELRETPAQNQQRYVRGTLHDFVLYLITDRKRFSTQRAFSVALEEALKGGVKSIQLREKDLPTRELLETAYWARQLTAEYGARLIVNDRVDIACAVGADGVHLGQKSMPPNAVRKIEEHDFIIGVSTHSVDEAVRAEREGADFITLGPVYETPSKMKYGPPVGINMLGEVKTKVSIPVIAIGGITREKVHELLKAGADGIAVISAILTAENVYETTKHFMQVPE
jgi:thiamine-phosphate pyrophosphorylase